MRSHHVLGITIALGGALLAGMIVATTNATPDQLDDPVIGDLARDTIRYATVAAAIFVSGIALLFVPGRNAKRALSGRGADSTESLGRLSGG